MFTDWESNRSHLLINPSYGEEQLNHFVAILDETKKFPGHLWLATSGSTVVKWVGLSKEAVLASALAVNTHLQSTSADCWIHSLPDFHVGGLGIWARSYLSGAAVSNYKKDCPGKWNHHQFYNYLQESQGTLAALVPAQLSDLVKDQFLAPPALRAVIIGGGSVSSELYEKAKELKWPILPTYGLTECASQVATADHQSPDLKILNHVEVKIEEGRIALKSPALLSVYARFEGNKIEVTDPKKGEWFLTEDRGRVENDHLVIEGRVDQIIKIGGESVDIAALEKKLQQLIAARVDGLEMTLLPIPDPRLGQVIHAATTRIENSVIEEFNSQVLPFEKIRQTHLVSNFPKSPLGKILRTELKTALGS